MSVPTRKRKRTGGERSVWRLVRPGQHWALKRQSTYLVRVVSVKMKHGRAEICAEHLIDIGQAMQPIYGGLLSCPSFANWRRDYGRA